jgi:uncharacterized protein DUF4244
VVGRWAFRNADAGTFSRPSSEQEDHMRMISTLSGRWARRGGDDGMSTAEYAVGTVAAAAFAGLLFKIVTSPEVRRMLLTIIHRALNLVG